MKELKTIEIKTLILLSVFISALILANLLGSKVITLFGVVTSVGIFAYPITFLVTEAIEEVRGKKVTRVFVYAGFVALLISVFLTGLSIVMPPASFYANNDAYSTVFSNSLRIIIASMVAFLIAQNHDIWAYHLIKKRTKGRFLWLRNNISTLASQLLDTIIFTTIAFLGVFPIIQVMVGVYIVKVIVALLDTPFLYGVRWYYNKSS